MTVGHPSLLLRLAIAAHFAVALSVASPVHASDRDARDMRDDEVRPEIALRVGPGISGDRLERSIVPITIEAGIRVVPHMFVGASFAYVVDRYSGGREEIEPCAPRCSGSSTRRYRLGYEFRGDVTLVDPIDPWLGFGMYYEHSRETYDDGNGSLSWWGFVYFGVRAGIDVRITEHLGVGPFVSADLGYKRGEYEGPNGNVGVNRRTFIITYQYGLGVRYTF
jgi:hypothetical protein